MSAIPPRVLKGSVSVGSSTSTITNTTSPWAGSPSAWNITVNVQSCNTSYPGTRGDYVYDGRDIAVGDWVSDTAGSALQITSIKTSSSTVVTAVAEDINLYNTYSDSTGSGNGCLQDGNCLVFDDHNGLAVLTPYASGYMSDTFSQNIFSRFNYTADLSKSEPVPAGGVIALAAATLNVTTMNHLAPGSQMKFHLPTGSNFYLTSLTTNGPMTVQCHSTSQYNDTNPYAFKSITGSLTDDGSFSSGGTTYYGPKNILLQNAEDQSSMNSFWLIQNTGTTAVTPALVVKILSFDAAATSNVLINADGTSSIT